MTIDVPQEFESFIASLVVRRRFLPEREFLAESLRLLQAKQSLAEEIQKGFEQIDDRRSVDGKVAFAKLRSQLQEQAKRKHANVRSIRCGRDRHPGDQRLQREPLPGGGQRDARPH